MLLITYYVHRADQKPDIVAGQTTRPLPTRILEKLLLQPQSQHEFIQTLV
jgi:hypothetical protein